MPICYGGGVSCIEDFHQLFRTGVEKVSINTAAIDNPELITEASDKYGSQSVIVSIDVRKDPLGKYWVYRDRGKNNTRMRVTDWANEVEELGAGEIFLNNVDRDGTYGGYDTTLIRRVTSKLNIPVIACGGARSLEDLSKAVENGGASAVAAGSLFVYWGKKKGILINYPSRDQLEKVLV
jgi:cyclase